MSWLDSVPWNKVLPILAAIAGAIGGVGGTDLYQSRSDESRRKAWQAYGERQAVLYQACVDGWERSEARAEALLERVLACECPPL